jgi:hypothetical protein
MFCIVSCTLSYINLIHQENRKWINSITLRKCFIFEIINSLGEAPGVQISNMGASPGETWVDSGNRTQAAALTAERLATGPTAHSQGNVSLMPHLYNNNNKAF